MHCYDDQPIYTPIFKLFLYSVYPVAVTEFWSFFTWINAHNSLDVPQIHSKLCRWIHCYTLFICAKDWGNRITCLCFIAIFAKCAKRNQSPCSPPCSIKRKKNKEIKMKHWMPLSHKCCEFNQISCVAYPTWWTAIMHKWCALEKGP